MPPTHRWQRLPLSPTLQVAKLPRLHDPVCGFPEEKVRDDLQEPRARRGVAADQQPRVPLRRFFELEPPQSVHVEARPRSGGVERAPVTEVNRRSKTEKAFGIECRHLEPRAPARRRRQAIAYG